MVEQNTDKQNNYECHGGLTWVQTLDDNELLVKFFDATAKEESETKKIKDEQIFPKSSQTKKIKKFKPQGSKQSKDAQQVLELETPVYVMTHNQYGVIRKVIQSQQAEDKGGESAQKQKSEQSSLMYEVRLSQSLENVLVHPDDLKRVISIEVRIHSFQGHEAQNVNIKLKVDSTVQQVLHYISQLAQIAPNFINIYHLKKKLQNSDILYKEGIQNGDRLLCIQGQGDMRNFMRFKTVSSSGWGYSQTSWDAIAFRPNKTIMVAGFGTYGITSGQSSFFCKYKYIVMNTPSEEREIEIKASEVDEQTKVASIYFDDELVEVAAGTDFVIQMRLYGPQNNFRVRGYYGYNGNSYKTFDNQDKDLFTVTYSSLSGNGTGVDSGQVPQLYYYLTG